MLTHALLPTRTTTHNVILSHTCSNNPDFTTGAQAACFDNNSVSRKHFQTTDPCLTAALLSLTNATRRPILIKQDVIISHSHPLHCLEPDEAPAEKNTKVCDQTKSVKQTNTLIHCPACLWKMIMESNMTVCDDEIDYCFSRGKKTETLCRFLIKKYSWNIHLFYWLKSI